MESSFSFKKLFSKPHMSYTTLPLKFPSLTSGPHIVSTFFPMEAARDDAGARRRRRPWRTVLAPDLARGDWTTPDLAHGDWTTLELACRDARSWHLVSGDARPWLRLLAHGGSSARPLDAQLSSRRQGRRVPPDLHLAAGPAGVGEETPNPNRCSQ